MKFLQELLIQNKKQDTRDIVTVKPRTKNLNAALLSKKSGAHKSPKDYDRQKSKKAVSDGLNEAELKKYYSYTAWIEIKDRSGEDNNRDEQISGCIAASSEENAIHKVKMSSRRGYISNVKVTEISKEQFEKFCE